VTPAHMWAGVRPGALLGPCGGVLRRCCCCCCCRATGAAAGLLLLGVWRVLQLLLPWHRRHLLQGHGCVGTWRYKTCGSIGHLAWPKALWHDKPWSHAWRWPKTLRVEPWVAHPDPWHLHWLHLVRWVVGCCCWEVAWDAGLACCW
jgi:hypothetical protein